MSKEHIGVFNIGTGCIPDCRPQGLKCINPQHYKERKDIDESKKDQNNGKKENNFSGK